MTPTNRRMSIMSNVVPDIVQLRSQAHCSLLPPLSWRAYQYGRTYDYTVLMTAVKRIALDVWRCESISLPMSTGYTGWANNTCVKMARDMSYMRYTAIDLDRSEL